MSCQACGGSGKILAYRPTFYETDSPEERADAIAMASLPCPRCVEDRIDQAVAAERDKLAKVIADLKEEGISRGLPIGYGWHLALEELERRMKA